MMMRDGGPSLVCTLINDVKLDNIITILLILCMYEVIILFIGHWMINVTYDIQVVFLMLPWMTRKSKNW